MEQQSFIFYSAATATLDRLFQRQFWSYEEDGVGLYEKEIKPFAIDESVSVVKIVEKGVVCIAAEEWAVEI